MIDFLVYLLKSSVVLVILYGFYQRVLARDLHYQRDRMFLMCSYVIALTLPSISFDFLTIPVDLQKYALSGDGIGRVILEHDKTQFGSGKLSINQIITYLYLSGSLILFGMFTNRVLRLLMIIRSAPKKISAKVTIVYLKHIQSPFTFFNYIFINQTVEQQHDWDLIYRHEQAHMAQRHSLDILLAELMIVVLWFNPLVWLLRQRIAEIHEYQADEAVLRSDVDIKMYQKTLLKHMLAGVNWSLISALGHQFIKRRIRMMHQPKRIKGTGYKLIILVPIMVLIILINTLSAQDQTFKCPVDEGRITSKFGMRLHPIKKEKIHHDGIDIAAVKGTPVYSITSGTVLETGEKRTAGKFIIIGHRNNWQSFYAQLDKIVVEADQKIKRGELVGYVGSSGLSTAAHLHFEIRSEGVLVDPQTQIDFSELNKNR